MIVEKLSVLLDFKGEKAIGEMKRAGATAERELGKASSAADRVGNRMMATGAAMVGAGLLVTRTLGKLGDDFVDAGRDVLRLQRMTGETAEAMSGMRHAATMSGVSVDALAKGYQFLAKNMNAGAPAFTELGVSVRDANGNLRGTNDVLLDVSTRLSSMTDVAERNALAQQIFGRSYAELLPLLTKGGTEIQRLSAEAAKYGLVLTGENLNSVKEYIRNQRELDATMQGLKVQIGSGVVGALNSMLGPVKSVVSGFQELPGPVRNSIGSLGMMAGTGLVVAGAASTLIGALVRMRANFSTAVEGVTGFVGSLRTMDGAMRAVRFAALTGGLVAIGALMQRRSDDARRLADSLDLSGTMQEQADQVRAEMNRLAAELDGHKFNEILGVTLWDSNEAADAAAAYEAYAVKLRGLEQAMSSNENSADLAKRGVDEFGNALNRAADETDDLARKQDELWRQLTGQFDSAMQVQDSWARVNESLGTYNQLAAAGKASSAEGAAAQRDLAQAVEAHARARADEYVAQVTANGGTVDAATKTGIYRQTLVDLANQYPAVRGQLQPTIDLANRTVVTQFLAQFSWSGDPFVKSLVEGLAGGKWNNDLVLQGAARAAVSAAGIDPNTIPKFDAGGVVPGRRGAPQLVMAHGGETILPTHRNGAGPGGGTVNVTVNGVVGAPRDVAMAISEELRRLERERRY